MSFKIKLDTRNDAFKHAPDHILAGDNHAALCDEIVRIFRDLSHTIHLHMGQKRDGGPIFDTNGNTIGSWEYKP